MQFLHNNKICHLDIKPENIIFDNTFWPVYIDFGFSKIYKDDNDQIILFDFSKGTEKYASPELYKGKKIDGEKADIFSLGAVLFNLVVGSYGFSNVNAGIYNLIKKKKYKDYWTKFKDKNLSDDFKDLYVHMVAYEPGERLTIEQILNSPWLKEVNNINEDNFKKETNDQYNSMKSANVVAIEQKISQGGYITRSSDENGGEIFENKELKPKKIFKDRINLNTKYILIKGYLPEEEVNFMNHLEKKILKTFDNYDEPLEENLKFRATFEANEEMERGECTMDIELLEYEKKDDEEKKYLIEFVRKGV